MASKESDNGWLYSKYSVSISVLINQYGDRYLKKLIPVLHLKFQHGRQHFEKGGKISSCLFLAAVPIKMSLKNEVYCNILSGILIDKTMDDKLMINKIWYLICTWKWYDLASARIMA